MTTLPNLLSQAEEVETDPRIEDKTCQLCGADDVALSESFVCWACVEDQRTETVSLVER